MLSIGDENYTQLIWIIIRQFIRTPINQPVLWNVIMLIYFHEAVDLFELSCHSLQKRLAKDLISEVVLSTQYGPPENEHVL